MAGKLRREVVQWPSIGERNVNCQVQYATPVTDAMGGREEPIWTEFVHSWWAMVTTIPIVPNETDAVILYEVEGPYVAEILERFITGVGLRIVTADLTLKVFQVEKKQLKNRTLIAHCANAMNTQ